MRLLLHACCGPCTIEPLDALSIEHDVTVAFVNPNIHPLAEHRRRRDTLAEYVAEVGLPMVEASYAPAEWIQAVAGRTDDQRERCAACYRLRLGLTAQIARERGFDAIATTLTVSPYQDPAAISEAGRAAAAEAKVTYLETDYRDRYRSAVDRSKQRGMYRQRYCGCLLSEVEANERRSGRRGDREDDGA